MITILHRLSIDKSIGHIDSKSLIVRPIKVIIPVGRNRLARIGTLLATCLRVNSEKSSA
jgi:hypothetical protein